MAISINYRPQVAAYSTASSPSTTVYSNWSAVWPSGVIYGFLIEDNTDINSSIQINIYEIGTETLLDSITTRPFRVGTFYVDLASYIRAYLYSEYLPDFGSEVNCKDLGASLRFYITYQVTQPDGTLLAPVSEVARPMQVIQGAVQAGNTNNANIIEYVPLPDEQAEADRALFLTDFETPVMFEGFQKTLSFIYDNYVIGNEVARVQLERDANLNQVNNISDNLDISQVRAVNHLLIEEPTDQYTKYVDVYLTIGDAQNNYYVYEGYVDSGYTEIE